jgi:regulator of chromosome condensation
VVVTKSGDVVIWGLNACGGAFDDVTENETDAPQTVASFLDRLVNDAAFASTPRFLSRDVFFDGSAVEIAAVGYVHVAFLTSDGRVFTCDTGFDGYAGGLGNPYTPNEDGRLGRELVVANSTDEASSTNAGAALDVAEATKRAALAPGEVTVRDDANDANEASKDSSKRTPVVAVDAGRCHTVVADANGGAFAFGCGALGGAGPDGRPRALDLSRDVVVLPASTDEGTDRIENENENENETKATNQNRSASSPFAVDVAAGEYFTLVATRDGSVFAFGDGNSGQFGVDKEALRTAREKQSHKQSHNNDNAAANVAWFRSRGSGKDAGRVLVPVAGYQHAAAIVEAYGE